VIPRAAEYTRGAGDVASIRGLRNRAATDVSTGELATADVLGLYVHFPFCSVHCPYCDFAVDTRADIPHDVYSDAVASEIVARASWFRARPDGQAGPDGQGESPPRLVSIYFGGGTPGLWRPDALGRVIQVARGVFCADADAPVEITVEANPGEIDAAQLQALRARGMNRLSIGLQSLDDGLLRAIGRNHDAAAGVTAVHEARAAGVDNLSVDLMFGLPGQSMDDWRRSVEGALALGPDHVSAYALTIERGTPFAARARKGDLTVPGDDRVAAMQEWAREALAVAGLAQYEVSSYAHPGKRAVHNSLYWAGAPYLGVGASAASFRPLSDGTAWRFSNPRATETYLRAAAEGAGSPAPAQVEKRKRADLENEAVWLALRTTDGIDRAAHEACFGVDPVIARATSIRGCVERGWLEITPERITPTPAGLLFADEVAVRLWR
jgi:oxygen-independent coproporphyrinogen III oxidase